jgi:hypothetical protein
MARNIIGPLVGFVTWLLIATIAGFIMRETWPAYARVADAMTFTLAMMLARLSIGAFATIAMGFVSARITSSALAKLIPGIILLALFIPQHVMLWNKFPIWYHLWFLLSLVPLTYLGNRLASSTTRSHGIGYRHDKGASLADK